MRTIKAFIERHPVLGYFALAFAISSGGLLMAVGLEGLPLDARNSWYDRRGERAMREAASHLHVPHFGD